MSRVLFSLGVTAAALATLALSAEDFRPLMETTRSSWPEKKHIGVICDYQANATQVLALAQAAGEGALITVADTRRVEHAHAAATLLANHSSDYVVLIPGDRLFRDGSFGASVALRGLAHRGVPAVGTSPVALKQGAVLSQGDGTEGELLVTDRLVGTVNVILPSRMAPRSKASLVIQREGMATIAVHASK